MRSAASPFNPRPSQPGTELKGMLGFGQMHDEMREATRLIHRTGGIIPAQSQESAIVSAIRANEARVKSSAQKQQQQDKQSHQVQSAYAERYHRRDTALEEEQKRAEEAFKAGSVSYAIYQLNRQYGPSQPQTEASQQHPARQSPSPRPVRYESAPAPRQQTQKYITRAADHGAYQHTVHVCYCGRDARYMQAENNGQMRIWYCERHKPFHSFSERH